MADQQTARSSVPPIALELTTLAEGLPIKIDGRIYEIRHPASFSIGELREIDKITRRSGSLEVKQETTPDEDKQIERDQRLLCDVVLDAPEAVKKRLKPIQRIAILKVFTLPRTTTSQTPEGKGSAKASAKPSRGSRGSIPAQRRTSGTGTSRSRLSARARG